MARRTLPLRLGVYADLVYRSDGGRVSSDLAFAEFVGALAERLDELVVFGRLDPRPGREPHPLPGSVRFVALPFYPSLTRVDLLARALRRARRTFAAELSSLDAVWLFGPHPLSTEFARVARRASVPVVLGVRQYFPDYLRGRVGPVLRPGIAALGHGLELEQRRRARRLPAIVVGADLERRYAGGAPVLEIAVSLIRAEDIASREQALARSWEGQLRVLTVTRLDAEKNPLLLADVLSELRAGDERWRLTVAGVGPLRAALEARARELGVADALELAGYVPAGPELWRLYRESAAFLHVSLTEGVPQVLLEAQAAGLPIVATDVGGVRGAVGDGAAGLLVPPRDAAAAAAALRRLADDPELRRRVIEAALERAPGETLDAQLDRIVGFFEETLRSGKSEAQGPRRKGPALREPE